MTIYASVKAAYDALWIPWKANDARRHKRVLGHYRSLDPQAGEVGRVRFILAGSATAGDPVLFCLMMERELKRLWMAEIGRSLEFCLSDMETSNPGVRK